jgi:hypothetical protein
MSSSKRIAVALLALGGALVWAPAAAQDPTAEQLFDQGQKAMARRDWASACPTLRRSWERSAGRAKGALYHLARCEDEARAGRLATSLALWREVYPLFVDQGDIQIEATDRIRILEAKVARVSLRRGAGSPPSLRAELDGQPAKLDERIPVDAGRHVVRALADGHAPAQQEIDVADGSSTTLDLQPGPSTGVTTTVVPVGPPPASGAPASPPDEGSGSGWTTAGWITGGVGVAGLALFAISGVIISGAEGDIEAACDPDRTGCGPEAAEAADRGETWMAPNAIGLGVGLVGLGLGVTFLVIGAGDDGTQVAVRGDGVTLRGRF